MRYFSSAVISRHSHSHDDGHTHSHASSHTHSHTDLSYLSSDNDTMGHGHSHHTEIPKPDPNSDPKARFDIDDQGRKKLKLHPFQSLHAHDDGDYPELREMDLEGEGFEMELNAPKKTVMSRVKDFFNPHVPLINISAHSHGHEHGHSHSHSTGVSKEELEFYKTGAFRKNPGVKITLIGLGVNVGMAASKAVAGTVFHSQALIADAVHSVGDTISDVLTLATVNSGSKLPSDLYPLGFGKIETLGSLFVSSILLYAGVQIGWSSLIDIMTPLLPHSIIDTMSSIPVHSHSHTHSHVSEAAPTKEIANINAAWVALGSIVVKEWLFKSTKKIGESMGSKVLIANAWHHRVDSLTSVVALTTISTGYFLNIYWLDSVGGLIVSMMIIKVGLSGVVQSLKELVDKALPRTDNRYTDLEDQINVLLMQNDSQIVLKNLVVLPSGGNLNCNVQIGIPPFNKQYESLLTLDKIGKISQSIKSGLHQEFPNLRTISVEFHSN